MGQWVMGQSLWPTDTLINFCDWNCFTCFIDWVPVSSRCKYRTYRSMFGLIFFSDRLNLRQNTLDSCWITKICQLYLNCLLLLLFWSKSLLVTWINIWVTRYRIVTYRCIVMFRYFTNGLSTSCFVFKLAWLLSMGYGSHGSWV